MRQTLAAGWVALVLGGCGAGGGGADRCSAPWELPIAPPAQIVDRPEVLLGGTSDSCGVTPVSWRNATTGASGTVPGTVHQRTETVCLPLFGCFERTVCLGTSYRASVALAMGPNAIALEAGSDTLSACTTLTVTRVPDTTPPAVVSSALADLPGPAVASVTFSEPVDCATAPAVTLSREGAGEVAAVRACADEQVVLSGFALEPLGRYTLSVSMALADPAGNALAAPYARAVLVRTPAPPEIASVAPADGSADVPVGAAVQVVFTWPIDPATVSASALQLRAGALPVPADTTLDGATLTLRPRLPLAGQTAYTAEVAATLTGLDGQPIAAGRTWSFTTRDVAPPLVTGLAPPDGFPNFDPDLPVAATFTEPVAVAAGGFTVAGPGGAPLAGAVEVDGSTVRFRPASPLPLAATLTATLGPGVTDLAGNPLAAPRSWTFTVVGPGVGTWRAMSSAGAPSPRSDFASAWTGTELLVWGGRSIPSGALLGDGARYDPLADAWRPMSAAGAPSPRSLPIAAYTGAELLVWGGLGAEPGVYSRTGARYDPAADSWRPIAVSGTEAGVPWSAPTPRAGAAAAWSGSELVVLGGLGCLSAVGCPFGSVLGDGGQYAPAADRWRPVTSAVSPAAFPAFAWTGDRLLVFGSNGVGGAAVALSWDPAALAGAPLSAAGQPAPPQGAAGVFTGAALLVWGGRDGSGRATSRAAYVPATGAWRALSTAGEPPGGSPPAAVWTGTRLLVWGGGTRTGGLYDPAADAWQTTALDGAPSVRGGHAGVWTGSELLVWGGDAAGAGGRYTPPPAQ